MTTTKEQKGIDSIVELCNTKIGSMMLDLGSSTFE